MIVLYALDVSEREGFIEIWPYHPEWFEESYWIIQDPCLSECIRIFTEPYPWLDDELLS